MKDFNGIKIIGVDHGYGNMKTANHCFPAGVAAYDTEPLFTKDLLVYEGRYYLIGEGHKEFLPEKMQDEDYYVLTLAAIAMELHDAGLTEADVHIAAGLPLNWVSGQKEQFKAYLLKNKEVHFVFKKVEYHVRIVGADVFPQGFSAIADRLGTFKGVTLLADIGNGTMNLLYLRNGKPDSLAMFTEKFGTQQCVQAIRAAFMDRFQTVIDDFTIQEVLQTGTADIHKDYLTLMRSVAEQYVAQIFQRLREHEYNPALMQLYVVGGGGCLIRNFGKYDRRRVTILDDICATAKGYEYLAERYLKKGVKL